MSWETQGRQYHQWFGSGTADGGSAPDARNMASKVAYSALGQLPPTQRSTYEGWLANGGIDQVAAVLPGWTAGSGLAADLFHDTFFGPHESRTVSGSAQQVGAALAAGGAEATRTAGQHFADLVKIARPEAMARTMAGAVTKAKTPRGARPGSAGSRAPSSPASPIGQLGTRTGQTEAAPQSAAFSGGEASGTEHRGHGPGHLQ